MRNCGLEPCAPYCQPTVNHISNTERREQIGQKMTALDVLQPFCAVIFIGCEGRAAVLCVGGEIEAKSNPA
jgi:hypothetical protein